MSHAHALAGGNVVIHNGDFSGPIKFERPPDLADLAEALATAMHRAAVSELADGEAAGMVMGKGQANAEACRRALGTAGLLGEIALLLRSHTLDDLVQHPEREER